MLLAPAFQPLGARKPTTRRTFAATPALGLGVIFGLNTMVTSSPETPVRGCSTPRLPIHGVSKMIKPMPSACFQDRKRGVKGRSVAGGVEHGGRRMRKKTRKRKRKEGKERE